MPEKSFVKAGDKFDSPPVGNRNTVWFVLAGNMATDILSKPYSTSTEREHRGNIQFLKVVIFNVPDNDEEVVVSSFSSRDKYPLHFRAYSVHTFKSGYAGA
jgi:hypothetical protein